MISTLQSAAPAAPMLPSISFCEPQKQSMLMFVPQTSEVPKDERKVKHTRSLFLIRRLKSPVSVTAIAVAGKAGKSLVFSPQMRKTTCSLVSKSKPDVQNRALLSIYSKSTLAAVLRGSHCLREKVCSATQNAAGKAARCLKLT